MPSSTVQTTKACAIPQFGKGGYHSSHHKALKEKNRPRDRSPRAHYSQILRLFRDAYIFVQCCKFVQEVKGFHKDGIGSLTLVPNINGADEVWSGSWDKSMCIFKVSHNIS